MANTITSPSMNLPVPVVGRDPGPDYALNVDACFAVLDGHDHSAGMGVQITPSGLNINSDLSMNDNNLTLIKTLNLFDQVSPLAGSAPDLGCIYRAGADLYYNDTAGNQIQITLSGSVNAGAGSITGLPSGTASASFSAGTFTWRAATNVGATMDMASAIIREPGVVSAKGITLASPTALGADYTMTLLSGLPGSTQALNITSSGNLGTLSYDAIGQAMTSTGANAIAASRTRTTGTSVGAGGVAISTSCGNFSFNSASLTAVTNLSVTLTTSGRPVVVQLVSDGSGNASDFNVSGATTGSTITLQFLRGSTEVGRYFFGIRGDAPIYYSSSYSALDAVAAGTYTYSLKVAVSSGLGMILNNCFLIAYEL